MMDTEGPHTATRRDTVPVAERSSRSGDSERYELLGELATGGMALPIILGGAGLLAIGGSFYLRLDANSDADRLQRQLRALV